MSIRGHKLFKFKELEQTPCPFEIQSSLLNSFMCVPGEDEQSVPIISKDGLDIEPVWLRAVLGDILDDVMTRRPWLQAHGTRVDMVGYRPGTRL